MPQSVHSLDDAYCLGCGYMLRGLTTTVCPECGRTFDPDDASSYRVGTIDWKRVWGRRIAVGAVIVVIGFVFCPRDVLRSNITFTCKSCKMQFTADYWELKPPAWISFRYPGRLSITNRVTSSDGIPAGVCAAHFFSIMAKTDLHFGGSASCTSKDFYEGSDTTRLNDNYLAPSNAKAILRQLVSRGNRGVALGPPGWFAGKTGD